MSMKRTGRTTRLALAISALAAAAATLPLGGCFGGQAKEEREPFTEARWREMVRDDQQRLKSETQREREDPLYPAYRVVNLVVETFVNAYNYMAGDTPFAAAKNLVEPLFPDRRRKAIVYLADRDYGREAPYVAYYREMARGDEEPLVRAAAVRALNRARDREAVPIYVTLLGDPSELVRLEAVKALANIPEPSAVPGLIRLLQNADENADVRIAAADALRSHRTGDVANALVSVLRDPKFGVAWQARQSLKLMTGKDFRFDRLAWLNYLGSEAKPFG